ncbi:MAG: hypothetical protein IPF58_17750 [Saprospirales bacterium]|nr:hypothetical protein [Saprospirales bacterium]
MDKILISRDLNSGKYIVLVIGLILAIVLFINRNDKETVSAALSLLAIAILLYYLLNKAKKVEFDEKKYDYNFKMQILK